MLRDGLVQGCCYIHLADVLSLLLSRNERHLRSPHLECECAPNEKNNNLPPPGHCGNTSPGVTVEVGLPSSVLTALADSTEIITDSLWR